MRIIFSTKGFFPFFPGPDVLKLPPGLLSMIMSMTLFLVLVLTTLLPPCSRGLMRTLFPSLFPSLSDNPNAQPDYGPLVPSIAREFYLLDFSVSPRPLGFGFLG